MEEEIKLIILLVLTFCTFLKVRSTRSLTNLAKKPRLSSQPASLPPQEMSLSLFQQPFNAQEVARAQQMLFPPSLHRSQPIVTPSSLSKDEAYRRSFVGVTLEEDPANHYCSLSIETNPFLNSERRVLRSNEQYLKEIDHLLIEPVQIHPSFLHFPMQIQPTVPEEPMIAQQEDSSSHQHQKTFLKRKNIAKGRKFGKKKLNQKQTQPQKTVNASLFSSPLLQKLKKKRKQKSLVNIQKQIDRRYEEIRVLERLKQQNRASSFDL